ARSRLVEIQTPGQGGCDTVVYRYDPPLPSPAQFRWDHLPDKRLYSRTAEEKTQYWRGTETGTQFVLVGRGDRNRDAVSMGAGKRCKGAPARSRRRVANERVARGRPSQPPRPRVMRCGRQPPGRSVHRGTVGPCIELRKHSSAGPTLS